MRINMLLVLARSLTSGHGLSVGALALMRGRSALALRDGDLPPMMCFSPGASLPAAKADCELALFRWTEVQLPLLKQGAPTQDANR